MILFGGRGRNRTYAKAFGVLCTTIILRAHEMKTIQTAFPLPVVYQTILSRGVESSCDRACSTC